MLRLTVRAHWQIKQFLLSPVQEDVQSTRAGTVASINELLRAVTARDIQLNAVAAQHADSDKLQQLRHLLEIKCSLPPPGASAASCTDHQPVVIDDSDDDDDADGCDV